MIISVLDIREPEHMKLVLADLMLKSAPNHGHSPLSVDSPPLISAFVVNDDVGFPHCCESMLNKKNTNYYTRPHPKLIYIYTCTHKDSMNCGLVGALVG